MSLVVVVGRTYRTGSTLVQRILNTTGDAMIFGEDNYILKHIAEELQWYLRTSSRNAQQWKDFQNDPYNCFTANLKPKSPYIWNCLLERLNYYDSPLHRYRGFKQISMLPIHKNLLTQMKESRIDLRIVYCTRNLEDCLKSYEETFKNYEGFGQGGLDNAQKIFEQSLEAGEVLEALGEDHCFHVDYDNATRDTYKNMLDWLELPGTNLDKVLAHKVREMQVT